MLAYNPSTWEVQAENQKFGLILSYTSSSTLACTKNKEDFIIDLSEVIKGECGSKKPYIKNKKKLI